MLTPRIETVISENEGKINLAKVDIDDYSDLAMDYEVAAVPVLLAIRNGKIEQRIVGLQDMDKLRKFVKDVVDKQWIRSIPKLYVRRKLIERFQQLQILAAYRFAGQYCCVE